MSCRLRKIPGKLFGRKVNSLCPPLWTYLQFDQANCRQNGRNRNGACRLQVHQHGRLLVHYPFSYLTLQRLSSTRNRDGTLVASKDRFPSGIRDLVEYVHSKGLLFGLYASIGNKTCTGSGIGSNGMERLDAQTFVDWGIDYLKLDACNFPREELEEKFEGWSNLLEEYAPSDNVIAFNCW
jgi:hypothetical protein